MKRFGKTGTISHQSKRLKCEKKTEYSETGSGVMRYQHCDALKQSHKDHLNSVQGRHHFFQLSAFRKPFIPKVNFDRN